MRVLVTDLQGLHKYDIQAFNIADIGRFLMNSSNMLLKKYRKREFVRFNVVLQRMPENGRIDFDFVPDDK